MMNGELIMDNGTAWQELNIQLRARQFAVRVVHLASALPRTATGVVFVKQIVRSGTSIGANIAEAQDALSKPDFIRTMQIALKEARETLYWIDTIIDAKLLKAECCRGIRIECETIVKILRTIVQHAKGQ